MLLMNHKNGEEEIVYNYAAKALAPYKMKFRSKVLKFSRIDFQMFRIHLMTILINSKPRMTTKYCWIPTLPVKIITLSIKVASYHTKLFLHIVGSVNKDQFIFSTE